MNANGNIIENRSKRNFAMQLKRTKTQQILNRKRKVSANALS